MMHLNAYAFMEMLNGVWAILNLCLLVWFTYYIVAQVQALDRFSWFSVGRSWWKVGLPGHINAAIAIYVYHFGDLITRSSIWIWRHEQNMGFTDYPLAIGPVLLGSLIAAFGLLCKIRVFTYYRLGNRAWHISLVLALSIVFIAWMTHWNF